VARRPGRRKGRDSAGAGDWLAPVAYLGAGLAAVFLLIAALPAQPPDTSADEARDEALGELVDELAELPEEWRATMQTLCADPVLQAEGVAPDCRSGTIILGDDLFDGESSTQLNEEGIRKLHLAVGLMLRTLRNTQWVWPSLESIELRGHADPRAKREPYLTNMRVSQRRPMAVMLYLVSDWALAEHDRHDLERLLVLSAASHSRPPKSCPEMTNECYRYWRRVEITPHLRDASLAEAQATFGDQARSLLESER
jgi:outer membrane protein OmpA-like peptidoglycan-associated protein